jgi:thiamine-phosphate diphosphorylase
MLGTKELAETVGDFLKQLSASGKNRKPWVVLDPVMISTSGHKLINDEAKAAMIEKVFPYADVLTPNKYEAEALLERKLETPLDIEQGAKDILAMGVKSVLIKGGHSLMEGGNQERADESGDVNATLGYAQDYFLSSNASEGEQRLCDGDRGVWIRSDRYESEHTHGTGCTLSSSIAAALALGHQQAEVDNRIGAISSIQPFDACCLGKAYVTAGIGRGFGLGKGPGPVTHTHFPSTYQHFPRIALHPSSPSNSSFRQMRPWSARATTFPSGDMLMLGPILPIVDTVEWVEKLVTTPGITDIQLRIKDETDASIILERVKRCQAPCNRAGVRLWINDHWDAAIQAGCFGVHVGQEDLVTCIERGGLDAMQKANLAFGVSTHSFGELAAALAVNPTYISLGPVFGTTSKKVAFDPQGLAIVEKWRQLIPPSMPFVVIGGIGDATAAQKVKAAGANCAAVIGAITNAEYFQTAVGQLNEAMS